MHRINSGRLFHLRWVQVIVVLVLATGSLQAQKYRGNPNFLDFNQKPYYFGITLGINSSNFKPFRSKQFLMSDSIQTVESVTGPGFNLGIVTNLKMGDYFDFRFLPTLSFAERNINYDKASRFRDFSQRTVESVFVEMPFQVRYKSAPFHDKRVFVIDRKSVV